MGAEPGAPVEPSRWGWPTTSGRARWAAAVLVVASAALVGSVLLVRTGTLRAVDLAVHQLVHGDLGGVGTGVARWVTAAGSSPVLYPAVALGAWLCSPRCGWARLRDGLSGLVVLGAGSAARFALSVAIGRARPPTGDWLYPATGFAFPSGHTTNTTIALGLLVLLSRPSGHSGTPPGRSRRGPRRGQRGRIPFRVITCVISVVAVMGSVAVGWSRVYLGVHWPTDVAAGWAFGLAWLAAVALLGDRWTERSASRSAQSAQQDTG